MKLKIKTLEKKLPPGVYYKYKSSIKTKQQAIQTGKNNVKIAFSYLILGLVLLVYAFSLNRFALGWFETIFYFGSGIIGMSLVGIMNPYKKKRIYEVPGVEIEKIE